MPERTFTHARLAVLLGAALLSLEPARAEYVEPAESTGEEELVQRSTEPAAAAEVSPSTAALRIVHPAEGARLPPVKTSFVYGSADPEGRLIINGQNVPIYPGGGFLTMIPFSTGTFTIQAELRRASETVKAVRRIFVAPPPVTSPSSPLTLELVRPDMDMELLPGDAVPVLAKGSPGLEAHFHIEGDHEKYPLAEGSAGGIRGVYRGTYIVQAKDDFSKARIKVTLVDKKRGKKTAKETPGRITRLRQPVPWMVEVSTELAILRAGPSAGPGDKAGYVMFPPSGTRLQVTGRRGDELRVRLSRTREAWISQGEVRSLPKGTPAAQTTAGSVSVVSRGRSALVRVTLGQKVPFLVEPAADRRQIDVSFFGVTSNTDWIHYDSSAAALVSQAGWSQEDADTYRLQVQTPSGGWWGYDARYEGTSFILELRSPPPAGASPLEGLTVAVDAGHSSDRGAVGPTGLLEKDANIGIALCLQRRLVQAGAHVVMIRKGTEHVPLYDRPKLAWQSKADVLVSVHNNALPDGENPFERNGYGVYYFHPFSRELARDIHAAYGDAVGRTPARPDGLRDDGLHYGNLALARTPQMPAVLTESAYVIVPKEEALLKTEDFRCACADAMVAGIKRYVRRMRSEAKREDEPAAKAPAPAQKGKSRKGKTP